MKEIISSSGIDPRRLKFELTETCLLHDLDTGRATLESLQQMGIQIELDDFGTGYSSLNLLKNLPINTLKIDRSLIHGIETGSQGRTLVRAAIAMAKAMSMTVIAEGVETERQESFLVEEGCDIMQGFRYARPMPLPEFTACLKDNTRFGSGGGEPRLIVLEAGNFG